MALDWAMAREHEPLSDDELDRLRAIPVTSEEVAEVAALVAWFVRRYPTARERFAYVRRARARWLAGTEDRDGER